VRAAADPRAAQDEHVVEVLDPLDPVQLRARKPQEARQVPLGLRNVFVLPALAGFHDADPVALLRGPQRGDAPAERQLGNDRPLALTHNLGGYPGEMVSFVSVVGRDLG